MYLVFLIVGRVAGALGVVVAATIAGALGVPGVVWNRDRALVIQMARGRTPPVAWPV